MRERIPIDGGAFIAALLTAPLLATLVLCWAIIPIIALVFGALPYLIIGTPTLLWMVQRWPPTFFRYALAGVLGNTLWLLWGWLHDWRFMRGWDELLEIGITSSFFAALWAGLFAVLYRHNSRSNSLPAAMLAAESRDR